MMYTFLPLGITFVMLLLSATLRAARKLLMVLPFLYFLAISTVARGWALGHRMLAFGILCHLILYGLFSLLVTLAHAIRDRRRARFLEDDVAWQIAEAHRRGIPMSDIYIDGSGDMRYSHDDTSVF